MNIAHERHHILTASGHYFDYLDPQNNIYDIYDIAHHLSNLCRFAGAVSKFYSVAQHSVLVSRLCSPANALAGLMHDDAEAFLVDIPRLLKQLLPDYKKIEERVERAVMARFGLPYPMSPEVHEADRLALFIEQRDLMPRHDDNWAVFEGLELEEIQNYPTLIPLSPDLARKEFLNEYEWLSTTPV